MVLVLGLGVIIRYKSLNDSVLQLISNLNIKHYLGNILRESERTVFFPVQSTEE